MTKATQNWAVGEVVKVGFLRLRVLAKIATPGNYLPDQYAMTDASGDRFYRFVPHTGLTRMASLDDAMVPRVNARELLDETMRFDERESEYSAAEIAQQKRREDASRFDVLLRNELAALVRRCDGHEGVRADGSNIDTRAAHMLLALVDPTNWADDTQEVA